MGISCRQLRFRRWLSHNSAGYCEIAPQGHFLALRAQGATAPLGPRNDKSGSLTPLNRYCNTCNCQWRSGNAATDAIGAYHFNGSLFVSAALCRERHAAPLQRHVRLAIVPPNLQSPWRFLPAKGTPRPFFTKKFEKSRKSPCGFCLRVVYSCFVDKKSIRPDTEGTVFHDGSEKHSKYRHHRTR